MSNNNTIDLMEKLVDPTNLALACQRVFSNKGAPGVDGMTVYELGAYLPKHINELAGRIRNEEYKPSPVLRVEIPKPDGGVRLLGIPTVIDRMVQQAVAQVLTPIFEPTFSDSSYGFRPGRSAQDAACKMLEYFDEGYTHAVDIDIRKYFDSINHDKLINFVREEVKDERIIRLIKKFLKSGVMKDGLTSPTEVGAPQGGGISPLLSNIYLTKLDKLLEARGHKFVRYADDCNIYLKTRRAAERVMKNISEYLEGYLRLEVNQDKSQVGSPLKLKFLGFSLWEIRGNSGIRPHEKSLKRFKEKVVTITKRNRGQSVERVIKELKEYTVGWIGYFGIASFASRAEKLDGWIRTRLRQYIWKQWKRVRTRFKRLQAHGIGKDKAWQWANTRKGYWRVAHSPILTRAMPNKYLAQLGYDELKARYAYTARRLKERLDC
jgi:group II intron reverse transcriptase/maturase